MNNKIKIVKISSNGEEKKLIYKENQNKSGIYRWINKITNDTYIGSAVNLSRRFREYFSRNFLSKEILKNNSIIYRALLKYGYSNFNLEILEYSDKVSLIKREQYYLDLLNPSYNICKIAGSSLGRITKDFTRLKLKRAWMLRLLKKNNFHLNQDNYSIFVLTWYENKVKKLEKRTVKLQQMFNKITEKKACVNKSYVVRMKILNSTATAITVWVTDLTTGISIAYPSARNAALTLNCSHSTIMNKLKGKSINPYKGRYIISNKPLSKDYSQRKDTSVT